MTITQYSDEFYGELLPCMNCGHDTRRFDLIISPFHGEVCIKCDATLDAEMEYELDEL